MKTRRHNFTLIELLVVIGIIAVLAGILLPTLNTVMLKTKITKARTEIKALEIAIKQYESTYGFLPVAASATEGTVTADGDIVLSADGYNRMIADLTCTNLPSASPVRAGNARGMRFLEIKNPGEYQDPWEHSFCVVIDTGYNGQILKTAIPGLSDTPAGSSVYSSCVVLSLGPDGDKNDGSPSEVVNKDNIYPFETDWVKSQGHSIR